MCGIAGFFNIDSRTALEMRELTGMVNRLAHRGPDGSGYFSDGRTALGFRRLSIVDLAHGNQPLSTEDGEVVSVCNGELYGYRDIRAALIQRGHTLKTNCDAEILPHLYEDHGVCLLNGLQGQFAFAIYDRRQQRILLARDQFGVCPLYYTLAEGVLYFASEIKALLANPRVKREVDLTGLDQILSFPGVVSPTTMFKDIRSLPPGHWLSVSRDGVEVREYWDLEYPRASDTPARKSERAYVELIRDALSLSVSKRLQADVPVGWYLSGGLDSSLVAGLASAVAPHQRRHSFSVSFGGDEMCEQRHQLSVVRRTHSIHHDVPLSLREVIRRLPGAIYHAESPIKETHDTACLALSQTARACGVPVALTGQGADEMFAGYVGYRFDEFRNAQPRSGTSVDTEERCIREQLWGDPTIAYDGNYATGRRNKLALYSRALRDEFANFDSFNTLPIRRERLDGRDAVQQRSYLDFKLRLGDHLLTDHGDRMAMAHGVEVRHPFLDLDVVNLVREIPSDLKLRDGDEKYILKEAASAYVDDEIVRREKFGWYAPASPAVVRANDPYCRHLLSPDTIARQGYFDPAAIERLQQQYLTDGFVLSQPYETDLLTIVLTFGMFLDVFEMPTLG